MNWIIGLLLAGAGVWYYETVYKPAHAQSGGPAITDPASIADAQQILAAWAATQGAQYSQTEPQSYWVSMFQNWANKGGIPSSSLRSDGILDQATLTELQYWFQTQGHGGAAPAVPVA